MTTNCLENTTEKRLCNTNTIINRDELVCSRTVYTDIYRVSISILNIYSNYEKKVPFQINIIHQ